ncbi:MAG: GntR family transcriptional regulator [Acidimicrobiia bacterium]
MARVDPISREMLSSRIKDRILQSILEGELQPGDRLVETRIARELGVSQSPVREAIRDLAGVGFLEIEPYRGARVRRFTREEFLDDMEIRGELEAIAAHRAASRISPGEVRHLLSLIEEMHVMAEEGDAHGQAMKNTEFHRTVVTAAGSDALLRAWTVLEPFARTYMTAMVPGTDLVWLGDRHASIVAALDAGDAHLAASVMREHAGEARELLAGPEPGRAGLAARAVSE